MNRVAKGCLAGCGIVVLLLVVAGVGGYFWIQRTYFSPKPPDPKVAARSALRPYFVVQGGKPYAAGTAVAVRLKAGGSPMLLTALHLVGPAGGYKEDVAPAKLDSVVRQILLIPFGSRQPAGAARGALRKTGEALKEEDTGVGGDIAAFKLDPRSKVNVMALAAGNPSAGEWVWLIGDTFDHEPETQRLFPGRVLVVDDNSTVVKLEQSLSLTGFSGAPVVNVKREVVGLMLRGGEGMGIMIPAGKIRKRLAESGVR